VTKLLNKGNLKQIQTDTWLGTTEIEHEMVVPLQSNVKMKSIQCGA
jgi:hypothetical protein